MPMRLTEGERGVKTASLQTRFAQNIFQLSGGREDEPDGFRLVHRQFLGRDRAFA